MGQSKRYPGHRIGLSIEETLVRPRPIGLTKKEVDPDNHPITTPAHPELARAYVRFHEAVIRPDVEVLAWTDRAVKVRWEMFNGDTHEVWVWRSAVDERPKPAQG